MPLKDRETFGPLSVLPQVESLSLTTLGSPSVSASRASMWTNTFPTISDARDLVLWVPLRLPTRGSGKPRNISWRRWILCPSKIHGHFTLVEKGAIKSVRRGPWKCRQGLKLLSISGIPFLGSSQLGSSDHPLIESVPPSYLGWSVFSSTSTGRPEVASPPHFWGSWRSNQAHCQPEAQRRATQVGLAATSPSGGSQMK